jgi:hypothetical protein
VGEALAGGEVVGEGPPPGEVREVGAGLGGDEGGAERAEDPLPRRPVSSLLPFEMRAVLT